jgi:hypothetical protein
MKSGIQIADDRTRSALFIRRDGFYADTCPSQRFGDVSPIVAADKTSQHDITAQLPIYTRGIAALTARLNQTLTAALNLSRFEFVDLKDAIDCKIGAHDKEHRVRISHGLNESVAYFLRTRFSIA